MYTRRRYGFWMTFDWSKMPFIYGLIYSAVLTVVFEYLFHRQNFDISVNWQPISVLGIAVAFYLGFKNNASYDRTWEARKIWGAIVNDSRSFGTAVCSFVQGQQSDEIKRELIFRHIAWLTSLRYQLRLTREWEHTEYRVKGKFNPEISEAYYDQLEEEVKGFICHEEFAVYEGKTNMAAQLLNTQSVRLQELKDAGYFEDF
jgi:putative membrane protein